MDSLRADHLPCYGWKRDNAPNITSFAEQATLFTNAYSNTTWTRSSGASILTSLFPSAHGVFGRGDTLSNLVRLPEYLQKNGWATIAVTAMGNISPHFGFDRGFDKYFELYRNSSCGVKRKRFENIPFWAKNLGPEVKELPLPTSDDINKVLFDQLNMNNGCDLFLFVWSIDTHNPFMHRDKRLAKYARYDGEAYLEGDYMKADGQKRAHIRDLYDDMIYYNDHHFGALINFLKKINKYDETMLILSGDHGESFGEHDQYFHANVPFNEVMKIPLIIKMPSQKEKIVIDGNCQHVDLMPTILDYCGIKYQNNIFHGRSLLDNEREESSIMCEIQYTNKHPYSMAYIKNRNKIIEKGPWPVIFNKGLKRFLSSLIRSLLWRLKPKRYLFDLASDPNELNNLYSAENKVFKELLSEAKALRRKARKQFRKGNNMFQAKSDPDEEIKKQLAVLGYIE
jgi:arylsulfatase A-like enzyme